MKSIFLIFALIFLQSCSSNLDNKNLLESHYSMINQGTICVERLDRTLKFTYFPFNRVYIPSGIYNDFKTFIYLTPQKSNIMVESKISFTKYNNKIEPNYLTTYYKTKEIYIPTNEPITLSWGFGDVMGTFSNRVGDIVCYTKKGASIYLNNKMIQEYKKFK